MAVIWSMATNVEQIARRLMAKHGLSDWTFTLGRGRETFGRCAHGTKTITISRHHVEHHTPAQVRNTILHEIAHALADPHAGHGEEWKTICRKIGAVPEAFAGPDYKRIPDPWQVTCPRCRGPHRTWRMDRREEISCPRHPDVPLRWVNTETGETWDGVPINRDQKFIYICSRCRNAFFGQYVNGRFSRNPTTASAICSCRFKRKEWVRITMDLFIRQQRARQLKRGHPQ
jgi:predicted SprT family Zn-dependent metalloprotease